MLDQLTSLYEEYEVTKDDTKILLLKIVEQSIRDYINLRNSTTPMDIEYYNSAKELLFNSEYMMHWGEYEISLEDILIYLSVDLDWFKRKVIEITNERINK